MIQILTILILILSSSFAAAVCDQGYVSSIRALETYKAPIVDGNIETRVAVIETVSRAAAKSNCRDVEETGLDILALAIPALRGGISLNAVEGIFHIASQSIHVPVKVKAMQIYQSALGHLSAEVRSRIILNIEMIALDSGNAAVISKALWALARTQGSVFFPTRMEGQIAIKKIEETQTAHQY